MSIKFRQGWTNFNFKMGDIEFFRISWDIGIQWCYFDLQITLLNFSMQIGIG